MKKLIILLLFIFTIFSQGNSQVRFGIRAGVNWNYVKADDILIDDNTKLTIPSKANMGYHFGVISQIELFNFFIQPELLFMTNKHDVLLKDRHTGINKGFAEQRIFRLDVPVMLGVKIKSLKLQAGPVGTVFLGDKSELIDIEIFEQEFKTMTFGYQAGVGIDFSKITLDLKYEGNLGKFGKELTVNDQTFNFDQRSNQIVFSIGILF